ncbi:MAG: gene transfer agent family protein [Pseudomonadota bacterium]
MVNAARGEVALTLNGEDRVMRLTLGALAALEARLECRSLVALAEKFDAGDVSSAELIALLAAGLTGAGSPVSEDDVANAEIAGGAVGAMRAGLALISAAFRAE